MTIETLPLSIGPDGLCLRGPLFNYTWSWDEIAMHLGCEPRESVTLHYLADGKIGLNINSHPLRVFARQDFAELVRRHGAKGASAHVDGHVCTACRGAGSFGERGWRKCDACNGTGREFEGRAGA